MALIALVSPGNAPGVTTTAFALTMAWPRPALLAECDPSGGHLLAGYFGGRIPYDRGLWQLALQSRHSPQAAIAEVPGQCVELDEEGQRHLLPGFRDPFQAVQVNDEMWRRVGEVFGRLGRDVIADVGEVDNDLPFPLVSAADLVLIVMRPTFTQAAKAKPRLAELRRALGESAAIGLCVVGEGPYDLDEIKKERNLGPFTLAVRIPADERSAAVLSDGAAPRRGFTAAPLMYNASLIARKLQQVITMADQIPQPAAAPHVPVGGAA